MGSKPEALQISFVRRNAPSGGPTSSAAYNDQIEELSRDLSTISSQWSQSIVPLTDALPDGTVDVTVDAFTNGLDARTAYVNHDATASVDSSYYSAAAGRPVTIYEDLVTLSTGISNLREDLEDRIDNLVTTAAQVAISDVASLYSATNVETALAEVMAKVDLLSLSGGGGGADLSNIGQHYVPSADNTWDIGTTAKGIRTLYAHNIKLDNEVGLSTSADGRLLLTNDAGTSFGLLQFGGTTSSYPALKRNSATLEVKLADDSDYAEFVAGSLIANSSGRIGWLSQTIMYSPSDGNLLFTNDAESDFGMLILGDAGAGYPALKRSSATLQIRLGDDSDYADLACGIVSPTGVTVTSTSGYLYITSRMRLTSPSDGNILLRDWAGTDFGLLQFGGTTGSFPALKRNGSSLEVKFADDSNYTTLVASGIQATGQIWSDLVSGLQPTGTTQDIDFSYGNTQMLSLEDVTGDVTVTLSNMQAGGSYAVIVTQDSAVARDITWPSNVQWSEGVTPTLSIGNSARDLVTLVYDGLYAYGSVGTNYS